MTDERVAVSSESASAAVAGRVFARLLRIGVLLCLAVATVILLAQSGEYPGQTVAGLRVAATEPLPLALVAWLNLAMLDGPRVRWVPIVADVADLAMLALTVPYARPGAPPVSLALPVVAALMAVGAAGVARELRGGQCSISTGWTGRP